MREYETMFVVQPEISDEGSAAILARLDAELEKAGSVRLLCEDWGKRKLAYEIENFHKGHYRILRFLDDGQVIPPLERALRFEESVLRFLTVLVEEEVTDIEARKARAAIEEQEQEKRAAERAEREGLLGERDAETERALGLEPLRDRGGPVPVAIRLDHGEHRRTAGRRGDDVEVVRERVEVDRRVGRAHARPPGGRSAVPRGGALRS